MINIKKILTLLFASTLLVACNNNNINADVQAPDADNELPVENTGPEYDNDLIEDGIKTPTIEEVIFGDLENNELIIKGNEGLIHNGNGMLIQNFGLSAFSTMLYSINDLNQNQKEQICSLISKERDFSLKMTWTDNDEIIGEADWVYNYNMICDTDLQSPEVIYSWNNVIGFEYTEDALIIKQEVYHLSRHDFVFCESTEEFGESTEEFGEVCHESEFNWLLNDIWTLKFIIENDSFVIDNIDIIGKGGHQVPKQK